MSLQAIAPQTRVRHDDYGDGTVLQADGPWLLILFDGQVIPHVGVHVEDVAALAGAVSIIDTPED